MARFKKYNRTWMLIYTVLYCLFVGFLGCRDGAIAAYEWDDYLLPGFSLLNDHNITIEEGDLEKARELIPEWEKQTHQVILSGYRAKNGGEMAWYFPTYAVFCVPLILLFRLFGLPLSRVPVLVNLIFLGLLLLEVCLRLNVRNPGKWLLLLLLSINPIVFYLPWVSAEVMIFSLLGIAAICAKEGRDHCAALLVSLAGTMNPVIMAVGLLLIAEYLIRLVKTRDRDLKTGAFLLRSIRPVIGYGLCYVIGLVPMIYNYYQVGSINLTAESFDVNGELLPYMWAYLSDLNFGMLPYYLFLLLGVALLLRELFRQGNKWSRLWLAAFFTELALYSLMPHINCGMSGISRYNAWNAVCLVFSFCFLLDGAEKKRKQTAAACAGCLQTIAAVGLLTLFGPMGASPTDYLSWTPIAKLVMNQAPELYSPLPSTFNSRSNQIDGGYRYDTPLVYTAEDGYVRKILAAEKDTERLRSQYVSAAGKNDWFERKLAELTEEERYISVPEKIRLCRSADYRYGSVLQFTKQNFTAEPYVLSGLSEPEEWGTWTDKQKLVLGFCLPYEESPLRFSLEAEPYGGTQRYRILVNGEICGEGTANGGEIAAGFTRTAGQEYTVITVELPDAKSPLDLGEGTDGRTLGLGLTGMKITRQGESADAEIPESRNELLFTADEYNAEGYCTGISVPEDWGTWTDGNELRILYISAEDSEKIRCTITASPFTERQRFRIFAGDTLCARDTAEGQAIVFEFDNPGAGAVTEILIELPDADSPSRLGAGNDDRLLGLGLQKIVFEPVV